MERVFRICLFIAGAINFGPSLLAFFPSKIGASYGIDVMNANYELLLRHRAIMFGIIGGLMIYSAITKKYYSISVLIGCISMVSFLVLYTLGGNEINAALSKVMKLDMIGLVILLVGLALYKFK